MDQAEQDIKDLAIKASVSFIQFYNSSTTVAIRKAIRSVEGLMLKFNGIGNDNPQGNYRELENNPTTVSSTQFFVIGSIVPCLSVSEVSFFFSF